MDLPKLVECNKDNIKLLNTYKMIMKTKGLTNESQKAFREELQLFMRYIKDINITEIDHKIVEEYLFYCLEDRKNGASAINRKFTALNTFFETLVRKDYLPATFKNPMYKLDKMKVRKVVKDFLSFEELEKVIQYLRETNDLRGLCYVNLTYSSACRISEIVQLNRDSINFETRRFKVIGKGQKERICYISEQAKESIIYYLNSRKDNLDPLLISRTYKRWSKRDIERYVKSLMQNVGIKKHITPHSFRHSILTHLRLKGARIEDLQLLAGHSSIQTTQSAYTHVGLDDVSEKFDKFFEN